MFFLWLQCCQDGAGWSEQYVSDRGQEGQHPLQCDCANCGIPAY